MLPEKTKKANIAAGVWFVSMFVLLYIVSASDGENIWRSGNYRAIAALTVHGLSLFTALWFYAKAKGYSGFLGVGLGFLYWIGLVVLLTLPDKCKTGPDPIASPIDAIPKHSNYFVRLFSGDVPLVITYWVWGGLVGGLLLGGGAAVIQYMYADIVLLPHGATFINTFYWFSIAVTVFLWVAIWRSAGKYQGSGWGVVARAMVVIGVVTTLGAIAETFHEGASIEKQVQMMNAGLPKMIDESTRLDSVEFNSDTLTYSHTIIDHAVDDFDLDYFQSTIWQRIASNICSNSDSRGILKTGATLTYSYSDMNGVHIADVSVAESDCQ